jgi:hypothetical protein
MHPCCNVTSTKKRVIAFALIGTAFATLSYFTLTAINSGTVLALSGVLGFAACPAMCAAMGGGMWLADRIRRKNKPVNSVKETTEQKSCYAKDNHNQPLENSV